MTLYGPDGKGFAHGTNEEGLMTDPRTEAEVAYREVAALRETVARKTEVIDKLLPEFDHLRAELAEAERQRDTLKRHLEECHTRATAAEQRGRAQREALELAAREFHILGQAKWARRMQEVLALAPPAAP